MPDDDNKIDISVENARLSLEDALHAYWKALDSSSPDRDGCWANVLSARNVFDRANQSLKKSKDKLL